MNNTSNKIKKTKVNNNIRDLENKKVKLLIDMGIISYQKIRNNILDDEDFYEISEKILDIDKLIYDENLELNKLNDLKLKKKCICGNEVETSDKFCSVCGENVEGEIKEYLICEKCNVNIDAESNYCPCCGNKILIL